MRANLQPVDFARYYSVLIRKPLSCVMGLDIARYSGGFCSRFVLSSVRCVISLTTDHSVGKNPLCRRGLHISSCQLCLRMGTIETCFGKILTASRAPLTRYTSPIPPAPTAPEEISRNLLVSSLPTITSGLSTIRPECGGWSTNGTSARSVLRPVDWEASATGRSDLQVVHRKQEYIYGAPFKSG
jgi:hypothetical protein